jgi:hypothetical protein
MTEVWPQEIQVGDRVWCALWRHPMLVVARDEDVQGPWFRLRRYDGYVLLNRFRLRPQEIRQKLYKIDPQEVCPHCGRTGQDFAMANAHDNAKLERATRGTSGARSPTMVDWW